MTRPQTPGTDPARAPGRGGDSASLPGARTTRITGLHGYEPTREFRLWFTAYDQPPRGGPTHSVHIVLPSRSGHFTLVELWQGPLSKLVKDAVTQGFMVPAAEVEQLGQLELFAGVG